MVKLDDLASSPADIQLLASEIAARIAPDGLLDPEDAGKLLGGYSGKYVVEEFAKVPGFPKAYRLTGPNGRRGKPKYRRCEIVAFIDAHKEGKTTRGGRPRRKDDEL